MYRGGGGKNYERKSLVGYGDSGGQQAPFKVSAAISTKSIRYPGLKACTYTWTTAKFEGQVRVYFNPHGQHLARRETSVGDHTGR